MTNISTELLTDLKDEEYRHEYAGEFLDIILARQIRALRKERGWTQAEFQKRIGTSQSFIPAIESEDYGSLSISTLKDLARAFDVYLNVRFDSFATLVSQVESSGSAELRVPVFVSDPAIPAMAADATRVPINMANRSLTFETLFHGERFGRVSSWPASFSDLPYKPPSFDPDVVPLVAALSLGDFQLTYGYGTLNKERDDEFSPSLYAEVA